MTTKAEKTPARMLHIIGVLSGIAAGAWLGSAEAPVQLVNLQISPYVISVAMVLGVFVARWTVPTLLKGTKYVWVDLKSLPHLIVWALLAGAMGCSEYFNSFCNQGHRPGSSFPYLEFKLCHWPFMGMFTL